MNLSSPTSPVLEQSNGMGLGMEYHEKESTQSDPEVYTERSAGAQVNCVVCGTKRHSGSDCRTPLRAPVMTEKGHVRASVMDCDGRRGAYGETGHSNRWDLQLFSSRD